MRGCRFIIVVILTVWSLPARAVLGYPAEPSESWLYPYIDELRLREPLGRFFISTGPYDRLEVAEWLEAFPRDEAGGRSLWLYGMLKTELAGEAGVLEAGSGWTGDLRIRSAVGTGERTRGEARGRFAYYSPLGVTFWTSVRASVNGDGMHKTGTRIWQDRGRAGVDYAGIAFRKEGFAVSILRDEVSWGADRLKGLLFSGTAPCFDMMALGYRTGPVAFTSFHSMLRGRWGEDGDTGVRRFVSAHRLEVLPGSHMSIGISEAVVYGGRYRTFEPAYMNPLTIFYADQWNSGRNDNILVAGDFTLLFPQYAEIRGEMMIDDFQYDFGNEPHEFGAGLSLTAVNPLDPGSSLAGASYYHIRNQTYGHFVSWNRFIHDGEVMGYDDGPDGDNLAMWVIFARPESMQWKADLELRRKGEGRATDVQDETGPRVDFPSGTVETALRAGIGIVWRPSHMWLLEVGGWYRRTRNMDNVEGADDDGWCFFLGAQFNLGLDTWSAE
jgi:hypothetical protein